MARTKSFKIQN